MKEDKFKYIGSLDAFKSKSIYLNINHLEKGIYTLNIIHKNKIIKKLTFNK
jgi:hypothetical protein